MMDEVHLLTITVHVYGPMDPTRSRELCTGKKHAMNAKITINGDTSPAYIN